MSSGRIIFKPVGGFSVNGRLEGNIGAFRTAGEGEEWIWEVEGNWSSPQFRAKAMTEFADWCKLSIEEVRTALQQGLQAARKAAAAGGEEPAPTPPGPEDKPTIEPLGKQLPEVSQLAWEVVEAANKPIPQFFNCGGELTELRQQHPGHQPKPHAISAKGLRGHLARLANFAKWSTSGDLVPMLPPEWLPHDMLEYAAPPCPNLHGITSSPYFMPDGSLITEPGYNSTTGVYLHDTGLKLPDIPETPSLRDAADALLLITGDLLVDFPFSGNSDMCHAIAAMLTPLVRPMIAGPTPLFMFDAPTEGTGKGLLVDAVTAVSTGGAPMLITEARSDDEWRKRIISLLKETPSVVLIDNLTKTLDSGALASALTANEFTDRDLGSSKMVTFPVRCTWLAAANNPLMSGEITRRTVRCRLDAMMEHPSDRSNFKHKPLMGWVHANRPELLKACFVLIRSWMAAGRPRPAKVKASYESWSNVVGGIVTHAGLDGFLSNEEQLYKDAAKDLEDMRAFVEVWWDTFKDESVGTGRLFDMTVEKDLLLDVRAGKSDKGARIRLGQRLSIARDRVYGKYRITRTGEDRSSKTPEWALMMLEENSEARP